MTMLGKQVGANRIVRGVAVPYPCGDPSLTEEADRAVRRKIVACALEALQADVDSPTVFVPDITV